MASDGREAVRMARQFPYAMVLMDLQMPEMDGIEATRAIRASSGELARIPVVALTANAMADDRKSCLAAGMDDFVAKPVRPRELAAAIAKWAGSRSAPAAAPPAPAADGDAAWSARFLEALGGDPSLVVPIARTWLTEGPRMLDDLRRAVEESDPKRVRDAAHRIKGGLLNLAGDAAAAAALDLEQAGASGDLSRAPAALRTLTAEHEGLAKRLERLVEKEGGAS
jgi:CheY-like chemotaxis protein/HPt (histidine-containing phosphotransfer) domain-containing protein